MANVQPSNSSELQLYRVLQRANLLQYFETFITQGGDDVQQLCEAGEDEFLEIMALVGMASKPLHVRRLQKALQEWVANPAAFEVSKKFPTHVMSMAGSSSQSVSPSHSVEVSNSLQDFKVTPPQSSAISTSTPWTSQTGGRGVSPSEGSNLDHPSPAESPQGDFKDIMKDILYNHDDLTYSGGMNLTHPVLLEHQITAIATAAAMLAQDLPPFEPKSMPKKQASKEIAVSTIMLMSPDDPHRMDALRKYAAIYGRFDSKRKIDRPMSLHEISVNEAAAQLCSHFPALLTRREELFPLARQVVRDSGYQYSKGHSRAAEVVVIPKGDQDEEPSPPAPSEEDSFNDLQSELTQITMSLSEMAKEQERIRSALRVLLEANDHEQMISLTSEMDDLNDRHAEMTKRRQRIVNEIAKFRKGTSGKNSSPPAGVVLQSNAKNPPSQFRISAKATIRPRNNKKRSNDDLEADNPLNTLYMAALQNHKDSLFEEGLRIAKQYGMSDFAEEIIGMKPQDNGNETDDSGVNVTTNSGSSSTYAANSTFPSSSSAPASSSAFSNCGASLFSSSSLSSPSTCASAGNSYSSNGITIKTETDQMSEDSHPSGSALCTTTSSHSSSYEKGLDHNNRDICSTPNSVHSDSINPGIINDTPIPVPNTESSSPQETSTTAQGSKTTTTTITTKSGQVIEVETRRSSRRKNGEPDYYLINGGEKRFRGSISRRSSSTSSERARRLSSSSSTSSLTPTTPTSVSPSKFSKGETPNSGDIVRLNVSELRRRGGLEIQKVILDVNQRDTGPDEMDDLNDEYVYNNGDSDRRAMRKKIRTHPYTGQRLLGSGDYGH